MWRLRNVPEVTWQQELKSGITHEPDVRAQTLSYYGALPLSVKTHPDALFTTTGNPRASHMHPMSQDLSVKDDQPNGMFCLKKKKSAETIPSAEPKASKAELQMERRSLSHAADVALQAELCEPSAFHCSINHWTRMQKVHSAPPEAPHRRFLHKPLVHGQGEARPPSPASRAH